jgi:hypothetical protein
MLIRSRSLSTILFAALLFGLFASSANAMTAEFGGADDPSLHGTTGSLSITQTDTDTYDVVWGMDFEGFEGDVGDHQYLTHIAFKAFNDISSVTLDSVTWTSAVSAVDMPLYPSNVNNGGCDPGSNAGMVCIELDPFVDATNDGELMASFSVVGDLKLSEWSYRGKFGEENGWVISESATPVPEPSAAIVFAVGMMAVSARIRARR